MKTIAITGASGFVGQHLLATLVKYSDCRLRVLVRDDLCTNIFGHKQIDVTIGDLTQEDQLHEFIATGCTVINLAYLPSNSLEQNLKAIRNLISVCKIHKIKRLIHCSTAAVAGGVKDTVVIRGDKVKNR